MYILILNYLTLIPLTLEPKSLMFLEPVQWPPQRPAAISLSDASSAQNLLLQVTFHYVGDRYVII